VVSFFLLLTLIDFDVSYIGLISTVLPIVDPSGGKSKSTIPLAISFSLFSLASYSCIFFMLIAALSLKLN